jgi:hypothetical protein
MAEQSDNPKLKTPEVAFLLASAEDIAYTRSFLPDRIKAVVAGCFGDPPPDILDILTKAFLCGMCEVFFLSDVFQHDLLPADGVDMTNIEEVRNRLVSLMNSLRAVAHEMLGMGVVMKTEGLTEEQARAAAAAMMNAAGKEQMH